MRNFEMKSKRQWVIIISLGIILIGAGIGGKKYVDYKHEQEKETQEYQRQEILGAEKAIVKDLEQYSKVREIQFISWFRDDNTGSVSIAVKVNKNHLFAYDVDKNTDGSYFVGTNGDNKNMPNTFFEKGEKANDVQIVYSTREEKK